MPRRRLTLALTAAAVLGIAPAALADTTVSIENGNFGTGLNGRYLYVTDTSSIFDKRMDVTVEVVGPEIKITDANGHMHLGDNECRVQGAAAFCPRNLDGARIEGSDKNDVLESTVALPTAWDGDHGDDLLLGGPDRDQLNGSAGDDTMRGREGNDGFVLERGGDDMLGDGGTDTVSYSAASVPVNVTLEDGLFNDGPTSEPDRLRTIENVIGSPNDDVIIGNDERNVISARAGDDLVRAGGGDDVINGNEGADDIGGGLGVDTVTYADRAVPVTVSLNDIAVDGQSGENDNIRHDVENLEGGSAGDVLIGPVTSAIRNHLDGNGGADKLNGASGDDALDGGEGDDTIEGDVGSDTYEGGAGTDRIDYSNRSGDFTEDLKVTLENSIFLDDGGVSDGQGDNVHNVENATTGDGDDLVAGSAGSVNEIKTGNGNDTVKIQDGDRDVADCGAGKDGVEFDFGLDLIPNCDFAL